MIVNDLDVLWSAFPPCKADTPRVVDSDAELAFSVSSQGLKTISRRNPQVIQFHSRLKPTQSSFSLALKGTKGFIAFAGFKEPLRLFAVE